MYPNSRRWMSTYPKCVIYIRPYDADMESPCYTITIVNTPDEERVTVHCCNIEGLPSYSRAGMTGLCTLEHDTIRDGGPRHGKSSGFNSALGMMSQYDRCRVSMWFVTCGRVSAQHIRELVCTLECDFSTSPVPFGWNKGSLWESDTPFVRVSGLHPDDAVVIMDSALVVS